MPQTGTVLRNRYKIINILGRGGFGDTYVAEDLDLPQHPKCVVKHLKPKDQNPDVLPVAKRLFENEAEILYRLGNLHDQIPKLFAHFEEDGEFYLVQEFIDGHSLNQEITPGRQFTETEVIKLLEDILEVLVVVHQQNIIHRDIKPANLMRRQDGKIVLIDFGAVKEIKGLAINTEGEINSTIIIGTSGYMANEQANRKPRLCSDVYAVGMIAIQALTGKMPQELPEDPSTGELIWRNRTNVSDKLANVLTNMVRSHFSQRYQSAAEVLQTLKPLGKPRTKLPPITIKIAGIAAGVIATGYILAVLVTQLRSSQRPVVVTNSKNNSPSPTTPAKTIPLRCGNQPAEFPSVIGKAPTRILKGGAKYYGSVSNDGKLTGHGSVLYTNGDWYSGEFKDGKLHGCGTYHFNQLSKFNYYLGEFANDKFDGEGKLVHKDNTEYIGEFKSGQCNGLGKIKFPDDQVKDGNWQNNKLVGTDTSCI